MTHTTPVQQGGSGWSDNSSTGSQSGSESDTGSDADSSSRGGGRDTAGAVRLAALSCLHHLAKADGRALHPFWIVLLPVYNPLQTKYHDATLMDAIVRDPVPKVRALAAAVLSSMLEGPAQKAYLIIAEATSSARPPVRGFTTLSSTLGHQVIALHDGLLHAISNEAHTVASVNILRALETLMLSAAYTRLPPDLLPRCIEAASGKLSPHGSYTCGVQVLTRRLITAPQKLVAISANTQASQTAACACLAAAFGTKGGLPSVANLLCAPLPQAADMAAAAAVAAPARQHALINTLLELSCSESAVLRCAALSALHGVAKNYIAALASLWDSINHAVQLNVTTMRPLSSGSAPASPGLSAAAGEGAPSAEAKCAQQAIKLLSEFLSGCYSLTEAKTQPHSGAAVCHVESSPTRKRQQGQWRATGTEAATGHQPSEQMPKPSQACSPFDSRGTEPMQTRKADGAAKRAQHAALPSSPTDAVTSAVGHAAEEAQCIEMWRQSCSCPLPQAVSHDSPVVRTAAQAALSELPYPLYAALPSSQQAQICSWVWHACQRDSAAAVRAAAAKCLGRIAERMPVQSCPSELKTSVDIMCSAVHDSAVSVRVPAASAIANLAEALQRQQQQHQQQLSMRLMPSLTKLASAAITACRDSDKVQVNAVRALGHLFTVQHPSLSQQREQLPGCSSQQHPACAATTYLNSEGTPDDEVPSCGQVNCSCGQVDCSCGSASCSQQCDNGRSSWWGEEWLVQGTQCLLSCLGSSTDKVQWNACYATGRLFKNRAAAGVADQSRQLGMLLSALLDVIRANSSFKIRSHAAAALANLGQRSLYGDLWEEALQTSYDAFVGLHNSGDGSDSSINAGKNYQFTAALQQQLQQSMTTLMRTACVDDRKGTAFVLCQSLKLCVSNSRSMLSE
ncbi:hypothetical protein ABBQ32_013262 [Trebouxia sp. C0010 RCD-2024]